MSLRAQFRTLSIFLCLLALIMLCDYVTRAFRSLGQTKEAATAPKNKNARTHTDVHTHTRGPHAPACPIIICLLLSQHFPHFVCSLAIPSGSWRCIKIETIPAFSFCERVKEAGRPSGCHGPSSHGLDSQHTQAKFVEGFDVVPKPLSIIALARNTTGGRRGGVLL